jgi:hypothetical protein
VRRVLALGQEFGHKHTDGKRDTWGWACILKGLCMDWKNETSICCGDTVGTEYCDGGNRSFSFCELCA